MSLLDERFGEEGDYIRVSLDTLECTLEHHGYHFSMNYRTEDEWEDMDDELIEYQLRNLKTMTTVTDEDIIRHNLKMLLGERFDVKDDEVLYYAMCFVRSKTYLMMESPFINKK